MISQPDEPEFRRLLDAAEAAYRREQDEVETMSCLHQGDQSVSGETERGNQHPADIASDTLEREIGLGLRDEVTEILAEIAAARARLDTGTYGRCEVCRGPIGDDRLRAIPWTRHCVGDERAFHRTREAARADSAGRWPDVTEPEADLSSDDPEDDVPMRWPEETALHVEVSSAP
jgi:RNA polymerase-binding transcription factor DksA